MKRTTNPALLRKYFAGTAEIGEESKDYVVEPGYALVFHGKIPY